MEMIRDDEKIRRIEALANEIKDYNYKESEERALVHAQKYKEQQKDFLDRIGIDLSKAIERIKKDFIPFHQPVFPWTDIALSILHEPLSVEFNHDLCPCCGNKRTMLYFSSPDWTWSMMCGRAGEIKICTHCKLQEVEITVLN